MLSAAWVEEDVNLASHPVAMRGLGVVGRRVYAGRMPTLPSRLFQSRRPADNSGRAYFPQPETRKIPLTASFAATRQNRQ